MNTPKRVSFGSHHGSMVETMIIEEMPSEEKSFYKDNILQEATQEWPQTQNKDAYIRPYVKPVRHTTNIPGSYFGYSSRQHNGRGQNGRNQNGRGQNGRNQNGRGENARGGYHHRSTTPDSYTYIHPPAARHATRVYAPSNNNSKTVISPRTARGVTNCARGPARYRHAPPSRYRGYEKLTVMTSTTTDDDDDDNDVNISPPAATSQPIIGEHDVPEGDLQHSTLTPPIIRLQRSPR